VTEPGAAGDPTAGSPTDDERLAAYARALAAGVEEALPRWVEAAVDRVLRAQGRTVDGATAAAARQAGEDARAEVGGRVRRLLLADIDEQRTNPLAVIRGAVRYPTEVLRAAGARPVPRDAQAREHFPDDDFDLAPARFADLDPALHEPGLVWGAAKAHVHLRRRRAEGRR
jgi:signal transduction histidine kinase